MNKGRTLLGVVHYPMSVMEIYLSHRYTHHL